jgi:hypothetical protein
MPSKRKYGAAAFTSDLDLQDDVWTFTIGVPDDRPRLRADRARR